jgi:pimeloyl-ACP methyl ester carboxylesterase
MPGLGADKRLFRLLDPGGSDLIHLEWISPLPEESLSSYAGRLAGQIDKSRPFSLIGVSIGGILAIEIAKLYAPDHLVIISSIKTRSEMPWYFHVFRRLWLHKLFPATFLRKYPFLIRPFFGPMNSGEYRLFVDMLRNSEAALLNWAQGAILHWDNEIIPKNILHLHGDKDMIFPIRFIKNCTLIPGGAHFMVVRKGREINRYIQQALDGESNGD